MDQGALRAFSPSLMVAFNACIFAQWSFKCQSRWSSKDHFSLEYKFHRQHVSSFHLPRTSPRPFASAARSTNPHDHLSDHQKQLFRSFNNSTSSHLDMKLTKMASLSNLISNIRGSEPSTPSARARGNFDNKIVDIAPCKTPKENISPFTVSASASSSSFSKLTKYV